MTPALLAVLIGLSATLLVWSLRGNLLVRWNHDVAWVEHTVWRFTPEPVDARRYVALFYAAAVLALFVLLLVMPSKVIAVGLWVVLIAVPRLAVSRAWAKRRQQIEQQLPVAVRQMSSSVASGMTLAQAIERLAGRAPDPIRIEFRIMTGYWQLGSDFTATIEEAKRRLSLENFNLFASAILVNQRLGGNVSLTLDRLAGSLEAIDQMKRDVYAATAEGRTNIKVLAVAPFGMLGLVALMDAGAVGMMLTRPFGHLLLAVAAVLTAAGTLWAWRIVNAGV
ncbi:MAG: type II secretion system F family protein [Planctomycetota bacterium]|jgi:tight adherence protein B